jgi:hypothetical protein
MPHHDTHINDILNRAAIETISEQELNILVSHTRKLSLTKECELKKLQSLLQQLELQQLDPQQFVSQQDYH